jgi:uroporphyrinogen-III decarboxylase
MSTALPTDPPLLAVLKGERRDPPPVWLMRQAGRYLPEYRALRAEKGGFLELVYDSDAAAEITIQPLKRFGMDGAILFSDILIVPHAMGQGLTFGPGEGPQLTPPLSDARFDAPPLIQKLAWRDVNDDGVIVSVCCQGASDSTAFRRRRGCPRCLS